MAVACRPYSEGKEDNQLADHMPKGIVPRDRSPSEHTHTWAFQERLTSPRI